MIGGVRRQDFGTNAIEQARRSPARNAGLAAGRQPGRMVSITGGRDLGVVWLREVSMTVIRSAVAVIASASLASLPSVARAAGNRLIGEWQLGG